MSAVVDHHDHGHAHDHGHHGPYGGLMRWITTTNHKDIGTMYLVFAIIAGLIGAALFIGTLVVGLMTAAAAIHPRELGFTNVDVTEPWYPIRLPVIGVSGTAVYRVDVTNAVATRLAVRHCRHLHAASIQSRCRMSPSAPVSP